MKIKGQVIYINKEHIFGLRNILKLCFSEKFVLASIGNLTVKSEDEDILSITLSPIERPEKKKK